MTIDIPGLDLPLRAGTELPPSDKGLIGYKHLTRWCAAQQNWDKVHYNQDYAREHGKLKDVYINGAIKGQFIVQFLAASFGYRGWVWRVNTDFRGMDFAEEHLVIHGSIEDVVEAGCYVAARVGFRIHNPDQGADTTQGDAIVLLDPEGNCVVEVDDRDLPDDWRVDTGIRKVGDGVPDRIREMVGKRIDVVESVIPVDLSRLRLMADAVMNVNPWHYHPEKAAEGPFGGVVAMPLYPLHGSGVVARTPSRSIPTRRRWAGRASPTSAASIPRDWECLPEASSMAEILLRFTPLPAPGIRSPRNAFSRERPSIRTTPSGRRSWSIRSTATAPPRAGH